MISEKIFKSYDIRGVYPTDFNEDIAYKITQAYVKVFNPKRVAVGHDVRESGISLFNSVSKAFMDAGVDVVNIGLVSTDTYYYAVGSLPVDGGITISASHNPREWNGMNFCKKNAEPISMESGLSEIKDLVTNGFDPIISETRGNMKETDVTSDFLKNVISYIDVSKLKSFKIVANANFGVDVVLLKKAVSMFNLPIDIIPLNAEPDGTFPKGAPNPLLSENRKEFLDLILKEKPDLGVSWDADGDRCFFADEKGNFIEGYFITAVLAQEILKKHQGAKIIIDPRLTWATTEAITKAGGTPVVCKPGMTIISAKMKDENAVFGGEMSSHFYFKENFNRDNGLIPLFLILDMISKYDTKLSSLVEPFTSKYFISGELNFEVENKDEIIELTKNKFSDGKQEFIDGLSVEYQDWRFNIRKSNTEPLLRLNVEALSNELMEKNRNDIIELINSNKK